MFVCGKSNEKHEIFVKRQESCKVRLARSSSRDYNFATKSLFVLLLSHVNVYK